MMMTDKAQQQLETVIGLEVHLQFNTASKIFCGCANTFGREANTSTCPVCLGLPGTLPVLNKKALESAIKVALALNCRVNSYIKFDRKNYYYPDLPKGYQISQYDKPIASDGFVSISSGGKEKNVRVHRAHLEEDAGKLIHDKNVKASLVDYNRTGTPLMEIVTEPDIRSPQEAYDYLTTLKLILQYLNVSDCDMEKGSLRCDANISLRPEGEDKLGTKTEIKNMNSFRSVKAGLEFEVERQRRLLLDGQAIEQETRLWDEDKAMTRSMRSKEEAHDYRYFPEPDLVPFILKEAEIEKIRYSLPEMPAEKALRFIRDYQLPEYETNILIQDPQLAQFFEKCRKNFKETKKITNWLLGPLLKELNERKSSLNDLKIKPDDFTTLIQKVEAGEVSNLVGKDILKLMLDTGESSDVIIKKEGLAQVSDEGQLKGIIDAVISENENVAQQIRGGKDSALGFLIGQTMKKSQGRANPKKVGEMIKRRLVNE